MDSEFVCSVEKENRLLGFYRIHTIWDSDKFKINVAAKDASWTGEMTREKLVETARLLQMTPETYLNDCKEALTTNDGKPGLVYAVENNSFVWKKVVDEDTGVKVKLGAVPVEPTNFVETIQKMMQVALSANKTLLKRLAQTDDEKLQADSTINNLFTKLEECNKLKENMESDLMAQFLAILNEKKRRISELEQIVIKAKADGSVVAKKPRARKAKVVTVDKVTVDPYDDDTDEDMPLLSLSAATNSVLSIAGPSATTARMPAVQLAGSSATTSSTPALQLVVAGSSATTSSMPSVQLAIAESSATTSSMLVHQLAVATTTPARKSPLMDEDVEVSSTLLADPDQTVECDSSDYTTDRQIGCKTSTRAVDANIGVSSSKLTKTLSSELGRTKSEDVLRYFFGGEDSPEPNRQSNGRELVGSNRVSGSSELEGESMVASSSGPSNKAYDIISEFF